MKSEDIKFFLKRQTAQSGNVQLCLHCEESVQPKIEYPPPASQSVLHSHRQVPFAFPPINFPSWISISFGEKMSLKIIPVSRLQNVNVNHSPTCHQPSELEHVLAQRTVFDMLPVARQRRV